MNAKTALSLRLGLATVTLVASMLVAGVAASPAAAASSAWFSSPSRNIGCMMTATFVRCDAGTSTYTPPSQPAWCHLGWGPSIGVGKTGRGHFLCVSDTVGGAPTILGYGTSRIIGRFQVYEPHDGHELCQHPERPWLPDRQGELQPVLTPFSAGRAKSLETVTLPPDEPPTEDRCEQASRR